MSYVLRRNRHDRFICEICNRSFEPAKTYQLLCTECTTSLKRFENTKGSGDTFDILVWAARRARAFKPKTSNDYKRGFLKAISLVEERLSAHEIRDARAWLKENV